MIKLNNVSRRYALTLLQLVHTGEESKTSVIVRKR